MLRRGVLYPIDHLSQPRVTHWRVVDPDPRTAVSKTATLTVTDVIDASAFTCDTPALDCDDSRRGRWVKLACTKGPLPLTRIEE